MSDSLNELREFIATQPTGPEWRTCAVCLCSIRRVDYNDHMANYHGYEVLNIRPMETLP